MGWNPSLPSLNKKFQVAETEVSVKGAPFSLACWVGIPGFLVLKVSIKYQKSSSLKYLSRELLPPLCAGLESQFI